MGERYNKNNMIPANKIKEISSKLHDNDISNWANELPKFKGDFPTKNHWYCLLFAYLVVIFLGVLACR